MGRRNPFLLFFEDNMENKSRLFVAGGAVILILTFFFPLWSIDLNAPQYPEGLGLRIWLNEIGGLKPNDLQSINGLNHYIGMQVIDPDDIPELKIMPYIIVFMILFGLLNAYLKSKKLIYVWIIIFLVAGVIGMYDFYMWEYDYGHQLNPDAPIKVPGMTYQPPLIGSKQLLNINAVSLPSIGTFVILISILLNIMALYLEKRKLKNETK
jgi:copper chaperone NosL